MRHRLFKPLALFVALSFAAGGATAALGARTCAYHSAAHGMADAEAATNGQGERPPAGHSHGGHPMAGHAGHDARSHDGPSPDDGNHSGGCGCLGQCLGGAAPPALAEAPDFREPSPSSVGEDHQPSDARLDRAQPPFLLPFANAPPEVS